MNENVKRHLELAEISCRMDQVMDELSEFIFDPQTKKIKKEDILDLFYTLKQLQSHLKSRQDDFFHKDTTYEESEKLGHVYYRNKKVNTKFLDSLEEFRRYDQYFFVDPRNGRIQEEV
jgi:hypothetical protein